MLVFAAAMSGLLSVEEASAAPLEDKSDVMTRLQDNTDSDHTITFTTPTGVAVGETITVTFPAAFGTAEVVEDDVDVKDDSTELTTAVNCAGSEDASVVMAADVLTVTICTEYATGIGTNSVVEIQIGANATASGTGNADHRITNPDIGADAAYEITIDATTDDGQLKVQILLDDSVNVTAVVDESLAFAITGDFTMEFGTLSASAVTYADTNGGNGAVDVAAHDMTVGTNATGGYIVTYSGSTLTSSAPGNPTIDVASSIATGGTPGTEQFAISLERSDNATITPAYFHDTPLWTYSTTSQPITIITEGGPTETETFGVHYMSNIDEDTEAGSYSTDITYIATATF